MGVHTVSNEAKKMNETSILDSYTMYLHTFIEGSGASITATSSQSSAIMSYDEFKEYFILKVLGRSTEFTANMARDYQYLSFDNTIILNVLA
ncbi:MAG: hypothetical protein L3J29_09985 [Cyclobacteriaceae bacterium]|nr:hypothetical protein [Cyclobacteriaceae bacterium]